MQDLVLSCFPNPIHNKQFPWIKETQTYEQHSYPYLSAIAVVRAATSRVFKFRRRLS